MRYITNEFLNDLELYKQTIVHKVILAGGVAGASGNYGANYFREYLPDWVIDTAIRAFETPLGVWLSNIAIALLILERVALQWERYRRVKRGEI